MVSNCFLGEGGSRLGSSGIGTALISALVGSVMTPPHASSRIEACSQSQNQIGLLFPKFLVCDSLAKKREEMTR